jgi:hypothetical protein
MQRLPLVTHIGLGDCIVQTGMARTLAARHGAIGFPCYERYLVSVKSFFVNDPEIEVYTLPHEEGWDWGSPPGWVYDRRIESYGMAESPRLYAGNYSGRGTDWDFTSSFYLHMDVPYGDRFDKCPIFEAAKSVEQLPVEFPYSLKRLFLHDDPERNFIINRYVLRREAYRPQFSTKISILAYYDLIMAAEEIHVIDSAFFHFINSLPFVPGKLFLHMYPRWPRMQNFRYPSRLNWHYLG